MTTSLSYSEKTCFNFMNYAILLSGPVHVMFFCVSTLLHCLLALNFNVSENK